MPRAADRFSLVFSLGWRFCKRLQLFPDLCLPPNRLRSLLLVSTLPCPPGVLPLAQHPGRASLLLWSPTVPTASYPLLSPDQTFSDVSVRVSLDRSLKTAPPAVHRPVTSFFLTFSLSPILPVCHPRYFSGFPSLSTFTPTRLDGHCFQTNCLYPFLSSLLHFLYCDTLFYLGSWSSLCYSLLKAFQWVSRALVMKTSILTMVEGLGDPSPTSLFSLIFCSSPSAL